MNIFRKNRPKNWVIKLFKITDQDSAVGFDMELCILSIIDYVSQQYGLRAMVFDLNYRTSPKTLDGFKRALKSQKEIVYSFIGFDSNKNGTYFSISNPMLNFIAPPENSMIDVCIQISAEFSELKSIAPLAENLIRDFGFEYGYITRLPANFDAETERKLKKGLFSLGAEINEFDHAWTFHSLGILKGYIKRLYLHNYLNSSHFANSDLKQLLSNHGEVQEVTKDVFKWTLAPEELEGLKKNRIINSVSIVTPGLEFLKTENALLFNDRMKL